MKMCSMRIAGIGAAFALMSLLYGGGTIAWAQGNNAQQMPQPQVSSETCAEVQWSPQLLRQYPRIPDACQEVIAVNGENWVRIEGRLVSVNPNGSVTSMVLDRTGRGLGRLTLKPAPNQKVMLEGRERTFDELQSGAILHMYIPEHMHSVATEPRAPESEMGEIEMEPSEEVAQEQLPATAGPLPWVLLAGTGILLAGLGLGLWRRFMR